MLLSVFCLYAGGSAIRASPPLCFPSICRFRSKPLGQRRSCKPCSAFMLAARRSGPRRLCAFLQYVASFQTAGQHRSLLAVFCLDAGGSAVMRSLLHLSRLGKTASAALKVNTYLKLVPFGRFVWLTIDLGSRNAAAEPFPHHSVSPKTRPRNSGWQIERDGLYHRFGTNPLCDVEKLVADDDAISASTGGGDLIFLKE
jgi:hypothetical protein